MRYYPSFVSPSYTYLVIPHILLVFPVPFDELLLLTVLFIHMFFIPIYLHLFHNYTLAFFIAFELTSLWTPHEFNTQLNILILSYLLYLFQSSAFSFLIILIFIRLHLQILLSFCVCFSLNPVLALITDYFGSKFSYNPVLQDCSPRELIIVIYYL